MAIQDRNEVFRYNGLPLESGGSLSSGLGSASRVEQKDQISRGKERVPKVRKPYTITKQRERWTDEEHEKFIEALKLYGRAWRNIEEHIGTKTAVQIRSHAQKYFTKVVRESSGKSIISTVESIEIPPPRPKKRPSHPYPRKRVVFPDTAISNEGKALRSISLKSLESDQENQSPKSVLSTIGLDTPGYSEPNGTSSEEDGSAPNADSLLDPQTPLKFEFFPKGSVYAREDVAEEPYGRVVKLFGANLLAIDGCPTKKNYDITEAPVGFAPRRTRVEDKVEKELSWGGSNMTSSVNDGDINDENPDDVEARSHMHFSGDLTTPREPSTISELLVRSKGFVPYKKFLAERENQPFPITAEERDCQSIRLSL
ncbi:hypothetical protein QN277_018137 [Acacia crassicarpa]|uniref:MYB transcription factor n=1 Tax=Acacia crassicarpa TaxID=499986 RepID=A0AAE1MUH6_9FABA|nr:hypothetical protein QN277_018137 [Acacia crassicarpa]